MKNVVLIDKYQEGKKDEEYSKKEYSESEIEKTLSIKKKIMNYVSAISQGYIQNKTPQFMDMIYEAPTFYGVYYFEGLGYISRASYEQGTTNVYFFGKEEDEAFLTAIYDAERSFKHYFDLAKSDNYDVVLRNKEALFEGEIPEELIEYYIERIKEIRNKKMAYDKETNSFVEANSLKKTSD